jgi:hypothetical protein
MGSDLNQTSRVTLGSFERVRAHNAHECSLMMSRAGCGSEADDASAVGAEGVPRHCQALQAPEQLCLGGEHFG